MLRTRPQDAEGFGAKQMDDLKAAEREEAAKGLDSQYQAIESSSQYQAIESQGQRAAGARAPASLPKLKKADIGVAKQMDDLKAAEREAAARGDYETAKELNSQYKALERQGQAAAAAAAAGAPSSAQKANAGAAKQMDDIKAAERAAAARGDYGAAMDLNKQYKAFESLQAAAGASLPAREDAAEASPRVQSAEAALKSSAALGRLQELRDVADDLQRKKLAAAVATKSTEERAAGMASEREELMEKAAAAQREIDAAKAAEKKAAEAGD